MGEAPFDPIFAISDPAAKAHGHFSSGETAIAQKTFADHAAWFVSLPSKAVEPMHTILMACGAHIYGEPDSFFYGGGGILVLHTLTGGSRDVQLRNGRTIRLDLPEGPTTTLMDSATGEVLLGDYSLEIKGVRIHYEKNKDRRYPSTKD